MGYDDKPKEELGSWRIVAVGVAILLVLIGVACVIWAIHVR